MNHEILIPEVEAEALATEGKAEQDQIKQERDQAYADRMDKTKELPKSEKRVIILDLSTKNNTATKSITLADPRIGANNSEVLLPGQEDSELPKDFENIAGVIFSGSAANIEDKAEKPWIAIVEEYMKELLAHNVPVLGICFGMQLHADSMGRETHRNLGGTERGLWKTSIYTDTETAKNDFFTDIPFQIDAEGAQASILINTMGFHNFRVGYSNQDETQIQGYSYPATLYDFENFDMKRIEDRDAYPMVEVDGNFYGVQFHPEVDTELGIRASIAGRKVAAPEMIKKGEDPQKSINGFNEYLEEVRSGKRANESNLFLRNFLDICGIE